MQIPQLISTQNVDTITQQIITSHDLLKLQPVLTINETEYYCTLTNKRDDFSIWDIWQPDTRLLSCNLIASASSPNIDLQKAFNYCKTKFMYVKARCFDCSGQNCSDNNCSSDMIDFTKFTAKYREARQKNPISIWTIVPWKLSETMIIVFLIDGDNAKLRVIQFRPNMLQHYSNSLDSIIFEFALLASPPI